MDYGILGVPFEERHPEFVDQKCKNCKTTISCVASSSNKEESVEENLISPVVAQSPNGDDDDDVREELDKEYR